MPARRPRPSCHLAWRRLVNKPSGDFVMLSLSLMTERDCLLPLCCHSKSAHCTEARRSGGAAHSRAAIGNKHSFIGPSIQLVVGWAELLRRQVLFLLLYAYSSAPRSPQLSQHHLRTELNIYFPLDWYRLSDFT